VELYWNSNPLALDTDGDGWSDSAELNTYGTDPNNPASHP
jgi:hypothetical protein